MTPIIEPGDRVQARKTVDGDVAATEFTVLTIDGGVVTGSPVGPLDEADGWTFELTRKGDPGLPTTLSDLAVWTIQERTEPTRVVGPVAGIWQTPQGQRIDPADVLAWEPWVDPAEEPADDPEVEP